MMILIVISVLLTLAYVLLIMAYREGWRRQERFVLPAHFAPQTFISVIVPARNERDNIGACIEAILAQDYPKDLLEVIVVDDHSDDGTADVVQQFAGRGARCISLAEHLQKGAAINAYKKAAIAAGIAESKGSLIVTTDADCTARPTWLMHIAAIYEQQRPVMVIAPVIYARGNSILESFQLIDFMSMQGITAASHRMKMGNMCNGANLAFSKAAYERVNGYEGITHLASGDDYLLMMKLSRLSGGHIAYLKSEQAIVTTAPQPTWKLFLQQRIRWASKSGKYNDGKLTAVLLLVYLFNAALIGLLVAGCFNSLCLVLAAGMLLEKTGAEYLFLKDVARFYEKPNRLPRFIALQPLHILYIVVAGFLGFMGGYKWKGRAVR